MTGTNEGPRRQRARTSIALASTPDERNDTLERHVMTKTNRYKVFAKMTTYLYVYVDANNYEEAMKIASDIDGGEFIPLNQGIVASGDWEITDAHIEFNK